MGGGLPDILKEETQLETPFGRVEVVVLRPQTAAGPIPTVAVNVGCYYTLAAPRPEGADSALLFGAVGEQNQKDNQILGVDLF